MLKHSWPSTKKVWLMLAGTGALMQGLYLGPSFWAVGEGLQPGVMALFGALQPPITAAVASHLLDEKITSLNKAGLALGVCGVALSVWPVEGIQPVGLVVIAAAVFSVFSITAGTLLQKNSSLAAVDILPSCAIQNSGACCTVVLLALVLGENRLAIGTELILALAWAVLVLSLGATTLLMWMVRTGNATRATSLLFLAPPLAAIFAWLLFDDALRPLQLLGFFVALCGVLLARHLPVSKKQSILS